MLTASISISLHANTVIVVLMILLCFGASIAFYRFTLPALPIRKKWMLSLLRSISLSTIVLLLFEPVVRSVSRNTIPPAIAVLVDDSQSMTIKDGTGDRAILLRNLLESKNFRSLSQKADAKSYLFSSTLLPINELSPDSVSLKGESTNLSDALQRLKDLISKENIQAAVIVSDGDYNVGKNPVYNAEALGIPIFTIGVGDTTEQRDILVEKVITNDIAYAETRVPVDVTIRSSGFKDENVEVTLSDGGAICDRKLVKLEEGTREYSVRLALEPKEEGVKKYVVGVSRLAGELTDRNNTRALFIKVLKSKLKVLILAGAPGPDVAAFRQILLEDIHLNVSTLVQKLDGGFYGGFFTTAAIESVDCVVLIGFPSQATTSATVQQLRDRLTQTKRSVLFVNGKSTDYAKLQMIEPMLPFGWSSVNPNEVFVFPSITERHKNNPLITFEGEIAADAWQRLPPVYKAQTIFRAKPEAEVLASVKLQNILLNEPLLLTRNVNGQRSVALTAYGLWRWRLMTQGNSQTEKLLSLFATNVVRWLTTAEDTKNVRVTPTKNIFTTAEPVQFTAQVYDEQLRPVDDADVEVSLQKDKDTYKSALTPIGNGRYEGSIEGVSEGDYSFVGNARSHGTSLGMEKGKVSIGQTNIEFLETKMNKPMLEQLAFRTGGKFYSADRAERLHEDLDGDVNFRSKELVRSSEIELWNWQYLVPILVLLLGLEWFIRKRTGML